MDTQNSGRSETSNKVAPKVARTAQARFLPVQMIREFYDRLQFPGFYNRDDLIDASQHISNRYVNMIDRYIDQVQCVLDAGCGTGYISNLLAHRHADCEFDAVDFADGVLYGQQFANTHDIKNITYHRGDICHWQGSKRYDIIICQGVLHHIPDYHRALDNLCSLLKPHGLLLLGLYHPWGKVVKRIWRIDYHDDILRQDQELNPFEMAFSVEQVLNMLSQFKLLDYQPRWLWCAALPSLLNYRNGGLVLYVFRKDSNELVD